MSEHFFGVQPSGRTRNYAHGGKGPFRAAQVQTLTRFALTKFQVCCTYHHPPVTPLHDRAKTTPIKL